VGLKIERAKQHFTDLVGKVDAWLKTNPYAFFRESDPESGDQLLRFQIQRDMPSDVWSPIIGDCIHNLRSALDHLVCALVLANRKKIYGGHQFPIYETADLYKLKSPGCVQGARKDAVKDIDSLKPYKGGNDGLWRLHLLDINDKHRGLIAVVGSNEGVTTDFSKLIASHNLPILGQAVRDDPSFFKIPFRPAKPCPLKDGDVLYRIARDDIGKGDDHPEITAAPAFYEPGISECEPIVPALSQLGTLVEEAVKLFDRFFP